MTDVSEQSVAELSVPEVLNLAADLLTPEGAWTQGFYAKDAKGDWVDPLDGYATPVCFCLYGAIGHVVGRDPEDYKDCDSAIMKAIGVDRSAAVAQWNDAPERTQAEVVAALRSAALLAAPRAGEGE